MYLQASASVESSDALEYRSSGLYSLLPIWTTKTKTISKAVTPQQYDISSAIQYIVHKNIVKWESRVNEKRSHTKITDSSDRSATGNYVEECTSRVTDVTSMLNYPRLYQRQYA